MQDTEAKTPAIYKKNKIKNGWLGFLPIGIGIILMLSQRGAITTHVEIIGALIMIAGVAWVMIIAEINSRRIFNERGFNERGFDEYGFDARGFDEHGFDARGFDARGFDKHGFDEHGQLDPERKPYGEKTMLMPILSKAGLLLTAMGFFLPAVENVNVFTAMGNLSQIASWIGIDLGAFPFFVYLTFISSVAGVVLLILLCAGKSISLKLEWTVVLTAIASFLIVLFVLNRELHSLSRGASSSVFDYAQVGFYLIFIGLILSFVFLLIASLANDTQEANTIGFSDISKKCPFCANNIKQEAIVCQFCHRDLPK